MYDLVVPAPYPTLCQYIKTVLIRLIIALYSLKMKFIFLRLLLQLKKPHIVYPDI